MKVICNECANLSYYKTSLRGTVQDYVLSFRKKEKDLEKIVQATSDLVRQLLEEFAGQHVLGRLVAKINFCQVNENQERLNVRAYHFPSYSSEKIEDATEFFERHMLKIASRLDSFNAHGSNLLIENIEHIHIQLTFMQNVDEVSV